MGGTNKRRRPAVTRVSSPGGANKRAVVSREDRIKSRQQLGKLRNLLMQPNLRARYERAVQRFFLFERLSGAYFSKWPFDLDDGLASFIEHLWQEGEPRYWGEDTVSGFTKFVPSLRGTFTVSWSLITAWQRHELPQRCVPINLQTIKAFCGYAVYLGEPEFALTLAIGYHGILRTAEMYHIAIGDMEIDHRKSTAVLTLPQSKSGTRYNVIESVVLDEPAILRRWKDMTEGMLPGDLLFPQGPRHFRKLFDDIAFKLELPKGLLFKPYSVRRGAATAFFRETGSMSKTCVRGRWNNEKSCRIYVNEAVQSLAALRQTDRCTQLLEHWSTHADAWFQR